MSPMITETIPSDCASPVNRPINIPIMASSAPTVATVSSKNTSLVAGFAQFIYL